MHMIRGQCVCLLSGLPTAVWQLLLQNTSLLCVFCFVGTCVCVCLWRCDGAKLRGQGVMFVSIIIATILCVECWHERLLVNK